MRRLSSSGLSASATALAAFLTTGCSDGEPAAPAGRDPLPEPVELFSAIDPMIGTGGDGFGVGSSYPGPAVPFGMIHPSPDTRTRTGAASFYHCSGYYAADTIVAAFSLLHFHGTGVPDYGTFGILPLTGAMSDARLTEEGRMQRFDKASEVARPGYYTMTLADGTRVEITASARAGIFRFGFAEGVTPLVVLDLNKRLEGELREASIQLDASGRFDGRVQHFGGMSGAAGGYRLHVHGELDVAPRAHGTFTDAALSPGTTTAATPGTPLGAWYELPVGTRTATLKVAVSFVDADGAKRNFDAEARAASFESMRASAEEAWKRELASYELRGSSARDRVMLATALYHALLMPTLTSDVDGRHVRSGGAIGTSNHGRYTDFSLWDTYRTLHPWLVLAEHPRATDFARSLVDWAREGGAVPVWGIAHGDSKTMIGSPGEIVLADSALKGVPFDDEAEAFRLAMVAADGPSPGPIGGRDPDLASYIARGWSPADESNGSVAKTLEYAVADAALARWAEKLGDAATASRLDGRGKSFELVYDPATGFFSPRRADGSFVPVADPKALDEDYVEGNAWHYLWMVPHDPDGLAALLGGREAALERARGFFVESEQETPILGVRRYYWPSNEPDITAPWFFAAWGSPGETHRWVDWAFEELYGTGVDGIPGNDDGGTMSAWLLFGAAGLYPIVGTDEYIVGLPRQRQIVLTRPSGKLTITTSRDPIPGDAPKRVTLDGTPLPGDGTRVEHAALVGDHVLDFEL